MIGCRITGSRGRVKGRNQGSQWAELEHIACTKLLHFAVFRGSARIDKTGELLDLKGIRVARLGRFERPTSGSGDQRSIRAELQAR